MAGAFPISGSIDPQAFPFLLVDLHHNGATGSLKVEGPSYQKALYFRSGRDPVRVVERPARPARRHPHRNRHPDPRAARRCQQQGGAGKPPGQGALGDRFREPARAGRGGPREGRADPLRRHRVHGGQLRIRGRRPSQRSRGPQAFDRADAARRRAPRQRPQLRAPSPRRPRRRPGADARSQGQVPRGGGGRRGPPGPHRRAEHAEGGRGRDADGRVRGREAGLHALVPEPGRGAPTPPRCPRRSSRRPTFRRDRPERDGVRSVHGPDAHGERAGARAGTRGTARGRSPPRPRRLRRKTRRCRSSSPKTCARSGRHPPPRRPSCSPSRIPRRSSSRIPSRRRWRSRRRSGAAADRHAAARDVRSGRLVHAAAGRASAGAAAAHGGVERAVVHPFAHTRPQHPARSRRASDRASGRRGSGSRRRARAPPRRPRARRLWTSSRI